MQPLVEASVTVAFVNPDSPNRDLAIEYLECAAEQAGVITRIMMMPGENEPVLNEDFEENLTSYDELIAVLEGAGCQCRSRGTSDAGIYAGNRKGSTRGLPKVSPLYSQRGEHCRLSRGRAVHDGESVQGLDSQTFGEYYEQQNQYLHGAITLDEFIRNIDQKLRMIVREGQ